MLGLEGNGSIGLGVGIVVAMTIIAGCMSGLTLSVFSLDENYLNAVAKGPNVKAARQAQRILDLCAIRIGC